MGNKVLVLDTDTGRVVGRIPVGRMPHTMVVSRDGAYVYTADMGSNAISVISTTKRAVVATIPVGQAPSSIALVER